MRETGRWQRLGSDREKCREEAKFDEKGQMKSNKARKWGGTKKL